MGDPSPWLTIVVDSVAALGAAGAAIVAVVLARREQRERQATQRKLDALREREQHQDLRRVFVAVRRLGRVGIATPGHESRKPTVARWKAWVRNDANGHITDVTVTVWPKGQTDPGLRDQIEFHTVNAGDVVQRQTRTAHDYILRSKPAFITTFNDASGRAWIINEDGELGRADATDEPHDQRGRRRMFPRRNLRTREGNR